MAEREQMGQSIAPGVVQRVSQGLSFLVQSVNPATWFGPSQPIAPIAQDQTGGRQWDYPVGYNLRITPREGEIPFGMLRAFADSYDLMRLVIETRKDQIEGYEWEIVPKDPKAPKGSMAAEVKAVSDFLERPDRELLWPQWLRRMTEELFVLDAMTFFPRADRGGHLHSLEILDGATIKRVLDDMGRTPVPPSVAYQQILHGIPANDLTTDDLIYIMRNPRVNRVYGYSPVEQVLTTVNIALRRQTSQLQAYTEGNIPEALAQVPETWTAKMIADFQLWFDGLMAGNTAQRRRVHFMPKLEGILFPRADPLKDEFDEWLARIICFAFSISPTALIKSPNRAVSEQMADTAREEGTLPLLKFLGAVMTLVIERCMVPGLRFQFKITNQIDPKVDADIAKIYVDLKAKTPDEVRADLMLEPMTPEQRAAAFPAPPTQLLGPDSAPAKPEEKPEAKEAEETVAKLLAGLQLHVHTPPVTVDAPVTLGDTHTHVSVPQQPAPVVKVYGDTHIQAPAASSTRRVLAKRNEQGQLFGEVTTTVDTGPAEALAKAIKESQA